MTLKEVRKVFENLCIIFWKNINTEVAEITAYNSDSDHHGSPGYWAENDSHDE